MMQNLKKVVFHAQVVIHVFGKFYLREFLYLLLKLNSVQIKWDNSPISLTCITKELQIPDIR